MDWPLVQHILERELYHAMGAIGAQHIAFWATDYARRREPVARFLPQTLIPIIIFNGCWTLIFAFLREPWDVAVVGDWVGKSYIDWVVWFVFLVLGGWGVYREVLYCAGKDRVWVDRFTGRLRDQVAR